MYCINSNTIEMTRGDTVPINFELVDIDNNPVTFNEGDKLVFTVRRVAKKDSKDINWLIQKEIVNGKFKIEPKDTADLRYGLYKWDIEYQYNNGADIETVLNGQLKLTEEVT